MIGGADRIDTSYEELRTDIQKRLSTAKSKEEYVSNCKSILEEIARRPDCDKFLGVHETGKTLFYDFTPELIMEVQKQVAEQRKRQFLGVRTIKTETVLESSKQIASDQREMEQEQEQGITKEN